jgi:hypothetical protein
VHWLAVIGLLRSLDNVWKQIRMNVINVIEDFFDNDKVTEDFAVRIGSGDIPMHQIGDLLPNLFSYYRSWRDNEEQIRAGERREIFCPLDPYPPGAGLDEKLNKLKSLVLYFPTISITDPIAEVIWPVWIVLEATGGFSDASEPQVRNDLAKALKLLARLRPFVEDGQISLLPSAFALDDPEIQEAVQRNSAVRHATPNCCCASLASVPVPKSITSSLRSTALTPVNPKRITGWECAVPFPRLFRAVAYLLAPRHAWILE